MTTIANHPVAAQLNALRTEAEANFFERQDAILVALYALLAKEHSFFLGVPGTGKSNLIDFLVSAITDVEYFKVGLSKTRPAEKVLGPLNVPHFRATGEYVLKRDGYLTAAQLAFVDEIGKMSPVLGHDLLALMNEREIHEVRDGQSVWRAPLYTMWTASNEILTDDSDDAAAAWDRLLVRTMVDSIQDDDNFLRMIDGKIGESTVKIEWEVLADVIDNVVPQVTVSAGAKQAIKALRHAFRREALDPSDRRWKASVKVLKAAAFLDGRDEVLEDDLVALQYTLWDTPEQIDKVARLCMACANPFVEPLLVIRDDIKVVDAAISERMGPDAHGNPQDEARQAYGKEATRKLLECRNALDAMAIEAQGRRIPKFRDVVDEHKRVLKRVFTDCLEQDEDIAERMMAAKDRLGSGYADQ